LPLGALSLLHGKEKTGKALIKKDAESGNLWEGQLFFRGTPEMLREIVISPGDVPSVCRPRTKVNNPLKTLVSFPERATGKLNF